jgi:co-chaperonin GroES (HSP10)
MSKHGIKPVEYKVLILPDEIEETLGSGELKLVKAEITKQGDERMQTRGTLIDFSDMSFSDWKCETPTRGSRVEYAMYAGQRLEGADGKMYRLMNDKDICAILSEGL